MTSGATTSTLSALVRPEVHAEVGDAVFRNSEVIPLFRQVGPVGGTGYQIKVIVAANGSAQVYVEDQAAPAAGYQQIVTATAAWKHLRAFTRLTGHARREMNAPDFDGSWPGSYGGGVNIEIEKAKEDLIDLANTTFLANAIYGLVGIVDDSTTNYYDLSRTTYAALASYVKTASAALSTALLDRMIAETYNANYGGKIELLVMPPAQARKYTQLVYGKLALPGAADVSGGVAWAPPPYMGIPIVVVRDLTATVIIGLSGMNDKWFFALHEAAPGGIKIDRYAFELDAETIQWSTAGALICTAPSKQGKLETLGTT